MQVNHTKEFATKNSKFNSKNLLCTDGFSNEIGGDHFSKEFRYIVIDLKMCVGEERCASKKEKDDFLTKNHIQIIYKNTYNDKKNTKNYLKTYLNDEFHLKAQLGVKK